MIPCASISSRPARTAGAATTCLSSPNTRSAATPLEPRRVTARSPPPCPARSSRPSVDGEPDRAQRAQRVGGERARRSTIRSRRAARSARPPCGSTSSPPASGSAIALTVKSRAARSAAMSSSRSGDEVDVPGAVRADDAPRAERARQLERRAARLRAPRRARRAAGRRARARSRSIVARPSSRSRTAPPTIQASRPGEDVAGGLDRRACHRRASCSRGTRAADPARDLVVDRAEPPRPLLREHPLAALARRAGRPRAPTPGGSRAEVDGDVVHRDRPDQRHAGGRR